MKPHVIKQLQKTDPLFNFSHNIWNIMFSLVSLRQPTFDYEYVQKHVAKVILKINTLIVFLNKKMFDMMEVIK